MDWGDVATWCATGVAVVSAVISVWWPWHNRPQASWFAATFEKGKVEPALQLHGLLPFGPSNGRGMPDMLLEMLNDGDGAAFNVIASMEGGECLIVEGHEIDEDNHAHMERPSLNMVAPIPEHDPDRHPWLWWYRLTHWRISDSRPVRCIRRLGQAVRASGSRRSDRRAYRRLRGRTRQGRRSDHPKASRADSARIPRPR